MGAHEELGERQKGENDRVLTYEIIKNYKGVYNGFSL